MVSNSGRRRIKPITSHWDHHDKGLLEPRFQSLLKPQDPMPVEGTGEGQMASSSMSQHRPLVDRRSVNAGMDEKAQRSCCIDWADARMLLRNQSPRLEELVLVQMLPAVFRRRVRHPGGRPVMVVGTPPAGDDVLEFRICCTQFFHTIRSASSRSPAYLVCQKCNK